ncbi:MAG: hypothetical protein M1820_004598 [Bogoriella megaspora]|nr:MAG: hypothetical protein M1820_004598 [Bogoriella megaspora]
MSTNISPHQVYLGHWVNWSYGSIRGSTLTLSQQNGALLTAFVAIFIGWAGTRIWNIICFMVHTSLSKEDPQDAVYHQRQAVFRNADDGNAGLWNLCILLWTWRGLKWGIVRRLLPFVALSLIITLAFTAAGVFSSTIASATGNEVLLTGANCAIIQSPANVTEESIRTLYNPYFFQLTKLDEERTLRCYSSESSTDDCSPTIVGRLPVMFNGNASCPFESAICHSNTTNLILESGYMNSHYDLGINSPVEHRFLYRVRQHCSPLVLDGYTTTRHVPTQALSANGPQINSTVTLMDFNYGSTDELPWLNGTNTTLSYPVVDYTKTPPEDAQGLDYTLFNYVAVANGSGMSSGFMPIPAINRTDADTIIIFLAANNVIFVGSIDDPWYSAHKFYHNVKGTVGSGSFTAYSADSPAVAVACATQYQACNPNVPTSQGCSPYMGLLQLLSWSNESDTIWGSDAQQKLFMTAYEVISSNAPDMSHVINIAPLLSSKSMNGGVQPALPANQWQLEMENWFKIELVALQTAFVDHANGPQYPGFDNFLWRPTKNADVEYDSWKTMCKNQVLFLPMPRLFYV